MSCSWTKNTSLHTYLLTINTVPKYTKKNILDKYLNSINDSWRMPEGTMWYNVATYPYDGNPWSASVTHMGTQSPQRLWTPVKTLLRENTLPRKERKHLSRHAQFYALTPKTNARLKTLPLSGIMREKQTYILKCPDRTLTRREKCIRIPL